MTRSSRRQRGRRRQEQTNGSPASHPRAWPGNRNQGESSGWKPKRGTDAAPPGLLSSEPRALPAPLTTPASRGGTRPASRPHRRPPGLASPERPRRGAGGADFSHGGPDAVTV